MTKFIIVIFLSLSFNFLKASEHIFITPKVALKMLDKKGVLFINLDKSVLEIKKSVNINLDSLSSFDVLGRLDCSSLSFCPKELENLFSTLGISKNQPLIIYDESYGVKSATLYAILESIGHKNIVILRGGIKDIIDLDPNWEAYNKYLQELRGLVTLSQEDSNQTFLNEHISEISSLEKKIKILKPHLLLQKRKGIEIESLDSNYSVERVDKKYLLSKKDLKKAINRVRNGESNLTIIDTCAMIDIVGNISETNTSGVQLLLWKALIDKEAEYLKSNESLEKLFNELGLNKENEQYLYCMSGSPKAFFVMMALRELGYHKTKVFIGDWNVWVGDMNE